MTKRPNTRARPPLTPLNLGLWALLALCIWQAPAARAGDGLREVSHDGLKRLVWMVDGRASTSEPAPTILALHGYRRPEQAREIRQNPAKLEWRRLSAIARREGLVVAFPSAYFGRWSLAPGFKAASFDDGSPIDDVDFVLGLAADLVNEGIADPSRLYITGISDGALISHRIICHKDAPFAAIASLIGATYEMYLEDCNPDHTPAVLHVHADEDQVLPYEGWIYRIGRMVSVAELMNHWRKRHGCTGQKGKYLDDVDPEDGSTVLRLDWTGCRAEPNVRLFKIKRGGHRVPALDAEQSDNPKWRVNRDLDTMEEVWKFLSSARR